MNEDKAAPSVWGAGRRILALRPEWVARHDGGARAATLGTCFHDGVLVTAAFDRLRAFDAATGEQSWAWQVPGRDVLTAMSDEASDGVALVAHWPDTSGGRSKATVAALDMLSGREMWSVPQDLSGHYGDFHRGILTHLGQRAVAATGRNVVALDSRTGRQEWTVPGGPGRVEMKPAADVLVLVTLNGGTATVEAVDAADGGIRWRRPLPVDAPVDEVRIVAADPLLVAVGTQGRRGETFLLELDGEGRTTREFPLDGADSRAVLAPWRQVPAVCGDTLVAFVEAPSGLRLAGYSLLQGRRLWTSEDFGWSAVDFHRGYLLTVRHLALENEGHAYGEGMAYVLDPADGRLVARRRLRVGEDAPFTVHLHGRRMLWVSKESGPSSPPAKAYRWR